MKKTKNLTPFYAVVFSVFIVFAIASIVVFFHFNRKEIENNAQQVIKDDVDSVAFHINSLFELQYDFLEGCADYLGNSSDTITADLLPLIENISSSNSLSLIALIDADGHAYYSDGSESDVSDRDYFTASMTGKYALSDPIVSRVSGATRIILSVPIWHEGEVIGVLGGSYDIDSLAQLLFDFSSGETGQYIISTREGTVICTVPSVSSEEEENETAAAKDNAAGTELTESETEAGTDEADSSKLSAIFALSANDSIFTIYNRLATVRSSTYIDEETGKKSSFSAVAWRNDYTNGVSNLATLNLTTESYYCCYKALGATDDASSVLSDWMLCYMVAVDDAHEAYSTFTAYETKLFQVLAAGLLIMLLLILVVTFRKQKSLVHFAETDLLTGINNKKTTEEYIKLWLSDEACYGTQAFLMVDIDHFKGVNDVYGHAVGDIVLSTIGQGLKNIFRESDIIGRLGGDEFGIFMKNASPEIAVEKAEQISQMVHAIRVDAHPDLLPTVSIGVALFPQHAKNFMDLYRKADAALYIAKNSGRDQYILYDIRTME
ncbi:MAG: sensor domain-containing diguanylate cyclase [Lachnospiraceae bacterium]|nr:sensor domain-containing diguanylate cyclase [Lachnospiraceae bacterium]